MKTGFRILIMAFYILINPGDLNAHEPVLSFLSGGIGLSYSFKGEDEYQWVRVFADEKNPV